MNWVAFFTVLLGIPAIAGAGFIIAGIAIWIDRRVGEPWGGVFFVALIVTTFATAAGLSA